MKRVLIISPYFPPSNAADMHRVRMSLPYFKTFGWDAEVVTVDEKYSDMPKDDLLLQSIPAEIKIHKVDAFSKKWTSKAGLGSIALRSLPFYRKKVSQLLKNGDFNLVYFSTTQFPVCTLGPYWKRKFKVPYVIDMQDPWHSEYYLDKPKVQRPKKYWFSYRLNKFLEPRAMKQVDGLISVSDQYIADLKSRYPAMKNIPSATLTFGGFEGDLQVAIKNKDKFDSLLTEGSINIVYAGRGGRDMHQSIIPVFEALRKGLAEMPDIFTKIKLYFIGTSYAPQGQGKPTILPLAKQYGVEENVVEITDRINYYHSLVTLQQADGLFIPGSDDPRYTASKIYPYLLIHRPLLTIFNSKSSAVDILMQFGSQYNYSYDLTEQLRDKITDFFSMVVKGKATFNSYDSTAEEKYSAKNMSRRQCALFDEVIRL